MKPKLMTMGMIADGANLCSLKSTTPEDQMISMEAINIIRIRAGEHHILRSNMKLKIIPIIMNDHLRMNIGRWS